MKLFVIIVAIFAFLGLLFNGIDYGMHSIALMTGNPAWDSESFKEDRFMNGLSMESTFSPSRASGEPSFVTMTFDNASSQSKMLHGQIQCMEPDGTWDIDRMIPDGWYVGANTKVTYSTEVTSYTGEPIDMVPAGSIKCKLNM